jgi:predicted Zn-dependent peptidase
MAVTQGKLVMGYRLGNAMMEQNHAAMMVFNALFGGAVTSKLFMNVREKLALCYYANSSIDRHKGIMVVSSGIEFSKFDEALNEITAQLEAIKNGEIEQWELDGARRAVVTAISASIDSPIGLESLYLDKSITGMRAEPEELAALAEDVRLDEVVKIAKGVVLDSVYFLTGDEDNA